MVDIEIKIAKISGQYNSLLETGIYQNMPNTQKTYRKRDKVGGGS